MRALVRMVSAEAAASVDSDSQAEDEHLGREEAEANDHSTAPRQHSFAYVKSADVEGYASEHGEGRAIEQQAIECCAAQEMPSQRVTAYREVSSLALHEAVW